MKLNKRQKIGMENSTLPQIIINSIFFSKLNENLGISNFQNLL